MCARITLAYAILCRVNIDLREFLYFYIMFKHIYHDFLHTNTNKSLIVIIYRIFSIMLPVADLMVKSYVLVFRYI